MRESYSSWHSLVEDERHLDQVLADEPGLELVGAQDVGDDHVVGAIVARLVGRSRRCRGTLHDDLVGFEQAGDLDGNLFPAPGGRGILVSLGNVAAHGDADAAEQLDALGDGVDHLGLLFVVLIEEEMELVEGGSGDLPVVLFVHVAKDDGVGEELVEFADHLAREPWHPGSGACPR